MNGRGWAAAIVLVVAVNALVLVRVAANRRGDPDASLTLTEREMPIAFVSPTSESSGVSLQLNVEHFVPWSSGRYTRDLELDPLAWLDADKLAALGFDVRLPKSGEDAEILMQRQVPRHAYAVIEHRGRAFDAYRRRLAERFGLVGLDLEDAKPIPASNGSDRASAERELRNGSRLFIVDVGRDPAALRQRYPDRNSYLIAPAKVRAFLDRDPPWTNCESPSCRVRGSVLLLIDEVIVPRRLQGKLPEVPRLASYRWSGEHAPRYEVVLRAGKRYEPWIEEIGPLASAK
jgi:hypothetical protein